MRKRNGFKIMISLIYLIKPLWVLMFFAIFFGSLGHIAAIMIPVLGILLVFLNHAHHLIFPLLIVSGILRGVLRYLEQALNHELAFRVLARLRDLVFDKMRILAPAKLETKDRGNLIALITSDIEQLEVFFAHTISPVFIALIVNSVVVYFMIKMSLLLGVISFVSYLLVGIGIPIYYSYLGREKGLKYRHQLADVNSFVLESVLGIFDVLQFSQGNKRIQTMNNASKSLNHAQEKMNILSMINHASVELVIFISNMLILILGFKLNLDLSIILISLVLHTSSFGPVIALSNLANNMYHTLASGDRVLDLLEEEPVVIDVKNKKNTLFNDVIFEDVSFSYHDSFVLKKLSFDFKPNDIVGIQGASGSGKSTILNLLMRIYEVNEGEIRINKDNIDTINTKRLKEMQSLMSQQTDLFQMSLYDNIRLGAWHKSEEDVVEAAKKSGIHDFIMTLANGYETEVSEFGSSLSSGERQRIALARLFIKDADLLILDEPTSNLDSLNEAIILESLLKHQEDKTIILTSHRPSTMNITKKRYQFKGGALVLRDGHRKDAVNS